MDWLKQETRDKLSCTDLINLLKLAKKKKEYYKQEYDRLNMIKDYLSFQKYNTIAENIEYELEKTLKLFE